MKFQLTHLPLFSSPLLSSPLHGLSSSVPSRMEEAARISRTFSSDELINRESSGAAASSSSYSNVREEVGVPFEQHNQVRHPELEPNHMGTSYRGNYFAYDNDATAIMGDDTWSCVIVLLTFWFFVSMTLILGVYGSVNILLGPSCSILLQPNPIFVQSIKLELISETAPGPMLYGFYNTPPLDAVSKWSETHNVSLPTDSHKEWTYYLNKESQINVSYDIYPSGTSIFLIIAQGSEGLARWFEDPTYPNTTLSWNVIQGSGIIRQGISKSSTYYVALGNMNSGKVKAQVNVSVRAYIYNTTNAYYKCNFAQDSCSMAILFPKGNAAVLTSPIPRKGAAINGWSVELSYGPRWVTYIIGIGGMTSLMFLVFNFLNKVHCTHENRLVAQYEERRPDRAPLLSQKDDDISSWGSSYDSVSQDDKDLEDFLAVGSEKGKCLGDGENSNNTRRLCAICFDAPRDCFFLPCGHCVACFACGTRIAEADGTCPICRRNMKKVRKIFTV